MLNLYYADPDTGEFIPFSNGTDMSNPLQAILNGSDGGIYSICVYLRNGDNTKYYKNIEIQPTPASLVGPSNPRRWTFKLLSGERVPTDQEWSARISGDPILSTPNYGTQEGPLQYFIPEIGAASEADLTYHPIWVRIEIPPKTPPLVEVGVKIAIDFDEAAV